MPMWHVHHPEGTYTAEERQEFAARVTALYAETLGLPRFYVSVRFHEFSPEEFFVGGEPNDTYVRIWIDHIARRTPDPGTRRWWMDMIDKALARFLGDRGLHWEIHIDDTPFEFWTIDGYSPPAPESAEERRWAAENKPSPLIGEPEQYASRTRLTAISTRDPISRSRHTARPRALRNRFGRE